jgi:hypothetical protein
VEDVVFVDLRFPSGQTAHAHVSWLDPHKLRKFTVVGTQKMVVFDDMEASEKIKVYDKGVDPRRPGRELRRRADRALGRHPDPEDLAAGAAQARVPALRRVRARAQAPLSDGIGGLRVVKVLTPPALAEERRQAGRDRAAAAGGRVSASGAASLPATCVLHPTAKVGAGTTFGEYCVVGANVTLGDGLPHRAPRRDPRRHRDRRQHSHR